MRVGMILCLELPKPDYFNICKVDRKFYGHQATDFIRYFFIFPVDVVGCLAEA
jgi:hypothetical protein